MRYSLIFLCIVSCHSDHTLMKISKDVFDERSELTLCEESQFMLFDSSSLRSAHVLLRTCPKMTKSRFTNYVILLDFVKTIHLTIFVPNALSCSNKTNIL